MTHYPPTLLFAILLCLSSNYVRAGQPAPGFAAVFGKAEKIEKIQDLEGTDYQLSHKYTLHFFLAGIFVSDDGYVLQKKMATTAYYPLSEQKIRELQQNGMLPSPLPKYSIPVWAYLVGYSLWIILAFAIAIPVLQPKVRRLMGKRYCPSCGLQLNRRELEAKKCGA